VITDDAVILGLLAATLGLVFATSRSDHPALKQFYRYVPVLLVCYFVPALYNTFGLVDGERSQLYFVASRYLLPATLVLLTIATDIPAIVRLGPKALVLFFTGTTSIIAGGPLAMLIVGTFSADTVSGDVWRGLSTVAGSWIGGAANQAAMREVYGVGADLFGAMVAVDILVAGVWMAVMLWVAGNAGRLDTASGADTSAITALTERVEHFERTHARTPTLADLMVIAGIGFGFTGLSHAIGVPLADWFAAEAPWLDRYSLTSSFFWIVVLATSFGLAASFTPMRRLEGAGASRVGQALLYVLIATVGMQMNLGAVLTSPGLFLVGAIWLAFHGVVMLTVARAIRAPMFYLAIGSEANIGGAASAPVVASAFHPSLAPVGVLLAVLGYVLGTYGGWLCGQLMRIAAGQ
jgi:uncharacterized membrane protein